MQITEIKATPVFVPLKTPTRSHMGRRLGTKRTIVQIYTNNGVKGIGETLGGDPTTYLIKLMSNEIIGEDPFRIENILRRLSTLPFFYGYNGFMAIGGIEMACWDIMGKATNQPVAQLLGGIERREIPVSAFVYNRESTDKKDIGKEKGAESIVEFSQQLIDKYGFKVIKYKSEGINDAGDLEVMRSLREHFGEEMKLRIDPNAAWAYEQALSICKKLEPYNLEYIEDPVPGIEAMSRLRREVNVPFATNMCVVNFEQLPIGIRTKAIDVILGDPHHWGGLWNFKKLAAVCETFKIGMSMHSGGDLGISTAAILQLAASTPEVYHAMDSVYYHYVGDIITEPFKFIDGCLHLPEGPGLGITIDQEAFDHYATMHEKQAKKISPKGYVHPM